MKLVACCLLLVAACEPGVDPDDYPVEPGGGNGSFGNTGGAIPDARGSTDGSGSLIQGRVCGLTNVLDWTSCASQGLDGLIVEIEAAQATTRDDGGFEIPAPSGTNATWRVSGLSQFKSLRPFGGTYSLPSINQGVLEETALDAGVVLDNGTGMLFVQVLYNAAPLAGATASLAGSIELVYYDDAAGTGGFSTGMTRADGIIWFPNVAPGTAVSFTVTPPGNVAGGAPKSNTVIVEDETATFATLVFEDPPQ